LFATYRQHNPIFHKRKKESTLKANRIRCEQTMDFKMEQFANKTEQNVNTNKSNENKMMVMMMMSKMVLRRV
jgi:hypothetical protein